MPACSRHCRCGSGAVCPVVLQLPPAAPLLYDGTLYLQATGLFMDFEGLLSLVLKASHQGQDTFCSLKLVLKSHTGRSLGQIWSLRPVTSGQSLQSRKQAKAYIGQATKWLRACLTSGCKAARW